MPPTRRPTALATAIREVKEKVGLCERCFNLAEGPLCRICADPNRDQATICVVEEPADVIPIERTHEYRGLYHVLGGALSPIDGVDADDLKIAELVRRVEGGEVSEVVLATNPTTTGEATALHIAELLRGHGHASPGWPAACRSAPTSSTPTRSPSARRSPAAAALSSDPMAEFPGRVSVRKLRDSGTCLRPPLSPRSRAWRRIGRSGTQRVARAAGRRARA